MSRKFVCAGGYNAQVVSRGGRGGFGETVVVGADGGEARDEKLPLHGVALGDCERKHEWCAVDLLCLLTVVWSEILVIFDCGDAVGSVVLLLFRLAFAFAVLNRWKYEYAIASAAVAIMSFATAENHANGADQHYSMCLMWMLGRFSFSVVRLLLPVKSCWANLGYSLGIAVHIFRYTIMTTRDERQYVSSLMVFYCLCAMWYLLFRTGCSYAADSALFLALVVLSVPEAVQWVLGLATVAELLTLRGLVREIKDIKEFNVFFAQIRQTLIGGGSGSHSPVSLAGDSGGSQCVMESECDPVVRFLLHGKYTSLDRVPLDDWDHLAAAMPGEKCTSAIRRYALVGDKVVAFALEHMCYDVGLSLPAVASMRQRLLSNDAMAKFFDVRLAELFPGMERRSVYRKGTIVEALVGVTCVREWSDHRARAVLAALAIENGMVGWDSTPESSETTTFVLDQTFETAMLNALMFCVGVVDLDWTSRAAAVVASLAIDRRKVKKVARLGRAALEVSYVADRAQCGDVVGNMTDGIIMYFEEGRLATIYENKIRQKGFVHVAAVGKKHAAENLLALVGLLVLLKEFGLVETVQRWCVGISAEDV